MIEIQPLSQIDAKVSVPGSKSITNRALLLAALAEGRSVLRRALFSDDTHYLAAALRKLGVRVEEQEETNTFEVWGTGGKIPAREAELFVGNAGTAMRFLVSYVALGQGRFVLDGVPRMRERPIQPLLDGLQQLGVRAYSRAGTGSPPVVVETQGLRGGQARLAGHESSQYFSALLMVGPYMREGLVLEVEGELVSKPFVDLTIAVMADFGVEVDKEGYRRFTVAEGQKYRAQEYFVEPDATNASYFFAAAAVTGGRVRVEGLSIDSAQGDVRFVDVLAQMGCEIGCGPNFLEVQGPKQLEGVEVDLNAMSDLTQTLAAIAPFARQPVSIRNVAHIRLQETDRLRALATELRRLGVRVKEWKDGLTIYPSQVQPAEVETYDDHRMAMSFAVTGLKVPGLKIKNPECVSKTFPDFWERFVQLGGG
ncbi:MAG TPA: 3-phosphoshikimate 1-carboxyvinyltransferase [Armatimonadetes bacterium]|nr:3-phosphoshikimate 1-carboxyvinyltransferase [Armatimonadota bacterium]